MLSLLHEEPMEAYGPSHEDIMGSNVLAFLSSSKLNSASLPLQKSSELSSSELDRARFLLQEHKSSLDNSETHGRSSSESMESFRNSMKRDFFMGVNELSYNCSDLDDDGLHGDRMKPLSSVETNCEMRGRFLLPQFPKRRGSKSPANSKILAAARVGRKARVKAMYTGDNKENVITTHMKDVHETCLKNKGVKRKSAGHEVNARFLVLKRKRSTLSSWQTTSALLTITPSVLDVAASTSISVCEEMQHFTRSPLSKTSAPEDADNYTQERGKVLRASSSCDMPILTPAALPASTGFPLVESREESSSSSHADPSRHKPLSFTKWENHMDNLSTKPPTYPKAKQSILSVNNNQSAVVAASVAIHDPACLNAAQCSAPKVVQRQSGHGKLEGGSEDLVGHDRPMHLACGTNEDFSCSNSYCREPLVGTEGCCNLQMEMCKLESSESTRVPTDPGLLMPRHNKSDGPPPLADKVYITSQPLRFENAPIVSEFGAAVLSAKVKQETSSQGSAEMSLYSQDANLHCELVPRDLPTSTRQHIKTSARKPPLVLHNALVPPNPPESLKPKDHTRAWGVPQYAKNQHNHVLPKVRRGRPPRKSNLCPCPEPKDQADKFARMCAPSGVFGKLKPGIITRLRDKKQVHAVLEAVIRGAFVTGMKENLKSQGAKHVEDAQGAKHVENADARTGPHDTQKHKAAECRNTAIMKGRGCCSESELDSKLGYLDQKDSAASCLEGENERQRLSLGRVELDPLNGKIKSLATIGVREQEQYLLEECAVPDVNLSKGSFVPILGTYPVNTLLDIPEVPQVNQGKNCPGEASNDQKVLGYNHSNAATTAKNVKGNVASCWLELLRLDIRGRLSALRRSRRRVRGVIVSGQLDGAGKANQVDEMENWRAFFVHMENVLCSEGTRLENWLNQITQMQLSYCQQVKSSPSNMPPLCGTQPFNIDVDAASS